MNALPAGTVTLLFSDMEGSTKLLSRLGDRYVDALDAQRKILRQAWADCEGRELGTEGDSFYVAFSTANDAVAAVAQAQRELASFLWPEGAAVKVRMGVHTGAPVPHDGAYVGMDVHRAARIAAAAHGGQITLSAATAELVSESLPGGCQLRDLGNHRLKDLPRPEHVYQLVVEGLESDFPPLRSLGASSTLPMAEAPLLGRDDELTELAGVVRDTGTRLLTLTGPGGTGKTSLAAELGRQLIDAFPDGIYFVPLADVFDAPNLWTALATALNIPPENRSPRAVSDYLEDRHALLLLDNLEQLPEADQVVSELLSAGTGVSIVATSRRPLHLHAETEFAVPPLGIPPATDLERAAESPAVSLFVRQARRVRSQFELTAENYSDVVELCRQLDGLPLAIELAAARSKLLSPRAIRARLGSVLDLPAQEHDRVSRHHTLRETLDWSFQLLDGSQQDFLSRLSVFCGGADLAAVTAVCGGDSADAPDPVDMLLDVVDASLASVGDSAEGEPRVALLETVRTYALEQLILDGSADHVRDRHARYFLSMVEDTAVRLKGNDHLAARAALNANHSNISTAIDWLLRDDSSAERVAEGVRLVALAAPNWSGTVRSGEAIRWCELAVQRSAGTHTADRAQVMAVLSNCARFKGQVDRAHQLAAASVEMLERPEVDPDPLPYALRTLAVACWERDMLEQTRHVYEQAIAAARANGDRYQLHRALSEMGSFESDQGDLERCQVVEAEALELAIAEGDPASVMGCRQNMACTLRMVGDPAGAELALRAVIPASLVSLDDSNLASIAEDYAAILAELGDHLVAAELMGAADAWHERQGSMRNAAQVAEIGDAIAAARAGLGEERWSAAHQRGALLTLEEVLAAAHHKRDAGDSADPLSG